METKTETETETEAETETDTDTCPTGEAAADIIYNTTHHESQPGWPALINTQVTRRSQITQRLTEASEHIPLKRQNICGMHRHRGLFNQCYIRREMTARGRRKEGGRERERKKERKR